MKEIPIKLNDLLQFSNPEIENLKIRMLTTYSNTTNPLDFYRNNNNEELMNFSLPSLHRGSVYENIKVKYDCNSCMRIPLRTDGNEQRLTWELEITIAPYPSFLFSIIE